MSVLANLRESEIYATALCAVHPNKDVSRMVPQITEVFSFFHHELMAKDYVDFADIPQLPSTLTEFKVGVFKKDTRLFAISQIPKGMIRYLATYTAGTFGDSKLSQELSGLLLNTLVLSGDEEHYEAEAFSYLLKSDFFNSDNKRNIVPFLALPSVIPNELEYQWVYLAMRKLHLEIDNSIEYLYLADEKKEIDLLKSYSLYP